MTASPKLKINRKRTPPNSPNGKNGLSNVKLGFFVACVFTLFFAAVLGVAFVLPDRETAAIGTPPPGVRSTSRSKADVDAGRGVKLRGRAAAEAAINGDANGVADAGSMQAMQEMIKSLQSETQALRESLHSAPSRSGEQAMPAAAAAAAQPVQQQFRQPHHPGFDQQQVHPLRQPPRQQQQRPYALPNAGADDAVFGDIAIPVQQRAAAAAAAASSSSWARNRPALAKPKPVQAASFASVDLAEVPRADADGGLFAPWGSDGSGADDAAEDANEAAEAAAEAAAAASLPVAFDADEEEQDVAVALRAALKHGQGLGNDGAASAELPTEARVSRALGTMLANIREAGKMQEEARKALVVAGLTRDARDHTKGAFSLLIHNGGTGRIAEAVSEEWPKSTVLTLEPRATRRAQHRQRFATRAEKASQDGHGASASASSLSGCNSLLLDTNIATPAGRDLVRRLARQQRATSAAAAAASVSGGAHPAKRLLMRAAVVQKATKTGTIDSSRVLDPVSLALAGAADDVAAAKVELPGAAAESLLEFQVLADVGQLKGDMLPHEFESFLGRLFLLARTTYVVLPLPDERFFSYWKDGQDLVVAAATTLDDDQVEFALTAHEKKKSSGGGSTWDAVQRKYVWQESKEVVMLRVDVSRVYSNTPAPTPAPPTPMPTPEPTPAWQGGGGYDTTYRGGGGGGDSDGGGVDYESILDNYRSTSRTRTASSTDNSNGPGASSYDRYLQGRRRLLSMGGSSSSSSSSADDNTTKLPAFTQSVVSIPPPPLAAVSVRVLNLLGLTPPDRKQLFTEMLRRMPDTDEARRIGYTCPDPEVEALAAEADAAAVAAGNASTYTTPRRIEAVFEGGQLHFLATACHLGSAAGHTRGHGAEGADAAMHGAGEERRASVGITQRDFVKVKEKEGHMMDKVSSSSSSSSSSTESAEVEDTAAPPPPPPPPPGMDDEEDEAAAKEAAKHKFVKLYDPKSKKHYYANALTKESSWALPDGATLVSLEESAKLRARFNLIAPSSATTDESKGADDADVAAEQKSAILGSGEGEGEDEGEDDAAAKFLQAATEKVSAAAAEKASVESESFTVDLEDEAGAEAEAETDAAAEATTNDAVAAAASTAEVAAVSRTETAARSDADDAADPRVSTSTKKKVAKTATKTKVLKLTNAVSGTVAEKKAAHASKSPAGKKHTTSKKTAAASKAKVAAAKATANDEGEGSNADYSALSARAAKLLEEDESTGKLSIGGLDVEAIKDMEPEKFLEWMETVGDNDLAAAAKKVVDDAAEATTRDSSVVPSATKAKATKKKAAAKAQAQPEAAKKKAAKKTSTKSKSKSAKARGRRLLSVLSPEGGGELQAVHAALRTEYAAYGPKGTQTLKMQRERKSAGKKAKKDVEDDEEVPPIPKPPTGLAGGGGKSARRDKSWASKSNSAMQALVGEERQSYRAAAAALKGELGAEAAAQGRWTLAVASSRLTLWSVKLARSFPNATVLSIHDDEVAGSRSKAEQQVMLLKLLGVTNNVVGRVPHGLSDARLLRRLLPAATTSAAAAPPLSGYRFRYLLLGLDVFSEMLPLCNGNANANANANGKQGGGSNGATPPHFRPQRFEQKLGRLLSLSATTFLEVPRWPVLRRALEDFLPRRGSTWAAEANAMTNGGDVDSAAAGGGGVDDIFAELDASLDDMNDEDEEVGADSSGASSSSDDESDKDVVSVARIRALTRRYGAYIRAMPPSQQVRMDIFAGLVSAAAASSGLRRVSLRYLRGSDLARPSSSEAEAETETETAAGAGAGVGKQDHAVGPVPASAPVAPPSSLLGIAEEMPGFFTEGKKKKQQQQQKRRAHASPSSSSYFLRVDLQPWARRGASAATDGAGGKASEAAAVQAVGRGWDQEFVSLETALQLGVVDEMKKDLFRMYIALPTPSTSTSTTTGGRGRGRGRGRGQAQATSYAPWDVRIRPSATGSCLVLAPPTTARELYSSAAATPSAATQVSVKARRARDALMRGAHFGFDEDDAAQEDMPRGNTGVDDGIPPDPRWAALRSELVAPDISCGAGADSAGGPGKNKPGYFSFVEWGSAAGQLSLDVARTFPHATVISVAQHDAGVAPHLRALRRYNVSNNIVCKHDVNVDLISTAANSPEFFRYQLLGGDLLERMVQSSGRESFGVFLGQWLTLAMTSFVSLPSSKIISLALTTFFPDDPKGVGAAKAPPVVDEDGVPSMSTWLDVPYDARHGRLAPRFHARRHPRPAYRRAMLRLLMSSARTMSGTGKKHPPRVAMREVSVGGKGQSLVRLDLVNMTRHVGHHFDWQRDGHKRKYVLRVRRNMTATKAELGGENQNPNLAPTPTPPPTFHRRGLEAPEAAAAAAAAAGSASSMSRAVVVAPGGDRRAARLWKGNHWNNKGRQVTAVYLTREKDEHLIPYETVYGVTLIAILRLGLVKEQRNSAYLSFMNLPLYEDMAPWNIVFQGPRMDYIDYDTKDRTFDSFVQASYQTMSVLFNYKRTVEDFKKCGPKARNGYNFPFISDCVGSAFDGPCKESDKPVPCGDGTCQPDYITCLKRLADKAGTKKKRAAWRKAQRHKQEAAGEWSFDSDGLVVPEQKEEAEDESFMLPAPPGSR